MTPDGRLLELIGDTHDLMELDEFRVEVLAALRRAVPADWASLNDIALADSGSDAPEAAVVIVDPPALELYTEVCRPMGVEHQIAFTLPSVPGRILGIALSRGDCDFSDDERDLLDRSRSFLIQAYRNAARYTEALAGSRPVSAADLIAFGLTARQAEVLRLVATGLSERDIAGRLGISHRTVQKHLERAYRVLGVTSRSAAAQLAWG